MNKKNMTFSHMIDVAEACIEVENQQSKHAIMHAAGLTEEELDTMWAQKRDDFFWSHNFGGMNCRADVYKGWPAVWLRTPTTTIAACCRSILRSRARNPAP